jgi:hypothetical protein
LEGHGVCRDVPAEQREVGVLAKWHPVEDNRAGSGLAVIMRAQQSGRLADRRCDLVAPSVTDQCPDDVDASAGQASTAWMCFLPSARLRS